NRSHDISLPDALPILIGPDVQHLGLYLNILAQRPGNIDKQNAIEILVPLWLNASAIDLGGGIDGKVAAVVELKQGFDLACQDGRSEEHTSELQSRENL